MRGGGRFAKLAVAAYAGGIAASAGCAPKWVAEDRCRASDATGYLCEAVTVSEDQSSFLLGTLNRVQWNAASSALELTAAGLAAGSGTLTSRPVGSGESTLWSQLSWVPERPYGKPVPATSESGYVTGNLSSTGLAVSYAFDEASGATAFADGSGNGRSLSCGGGASSCPTGGAAGKIGTSVAFDGVDDYLASSWVPAESAGSALTFAAWVYTTGLPSSGDAIFNTSFDNTGGSCLAWSLMIASGGQYLICGITADLPYATVTGASATLNTWQHIAAVYNLPSSGSGTVDFYLNGSWISTTTGLGAGNTVAALKLGWFQYNNTTTNYHKGRLDDAQVYTRALSATEVQSLYLRGMARTRMEVRSCGSATCADNPAWRSIAGVAGDTTTELANTSGAPPSFEIGFAPYAPYLQYRLTLETDSAAVNPRVRQVSVSGWR